MLLIVVAAVLSIANYTDYDGIYHCINAKWGDMKEVCTDSNSIAAAVYYL